MKVSVKFQSLGKISNFSTSDPPSSFRSIPTLVIDNRHYAICKIIFIGIYKATWFDLVIALTSCELKPLLDSWKHKTRSKSDNSIPTGVLAFHNCLVPNFPPLQFGANNSSLAFSVAPVSSLTLICHDPIILTVFTAVMLKLL